jgi:DNA polymerase III delta prime subunit
MDGSYGSSHGVYRCGICHEKGHNARTCPHRHHFETAKIDSRFAEEATRILAATPPDVAKLPEAPPVVPKPTPIDRGVWPHVEQVAPYARLMLLYGPPGTGKTTAACKLGNPENLYNVTLTEETPAAELRGHYVPRGGEFLWQDGPAMRAFREGARLVLNEIDKASSDALSFCHALLDDPGMSAITLPTGETVTPHGGFTVIATMNGVPEDLPEAMQSRFSINYEIETPHPDAIRTLPEELRGPAMDSIKGDPDRRIGFREWKAFAFLSEKVDKKVAAQAVFGSRARDILTTLRLAGVKHV